MPGMTAGLSLCCLVASIAAPPAGTAPPNDVGEASCTTRPAGGCRAPQGDRGAPTGRDLASFAEAFWREDAKVEERWVLRVFDVGGTGVKTGLISASALRCFTSSAGAADPTWLHEPKHLGRAPGESGFAEWLLEALPELPAELNAANVTFGVSTAGRLDHAIGTIGSWYGGGHPHRWPAAAGLPPTMAEIMGLPTGRTFAIHDGSAHLLSCGRSVPPPRGLAAFSLGTGVGLGLSSSTGSVFDRLAANGGQHHLLYGVPVSGAPCRGVWPDWIPAKPCPGVDAVLSSDFAGVSWPWRTPWVSLVLGSRGLELAEAAARCAEPVEALRAAGAEEAPTRAAARVFARQWLHFLRVELLPEFASAGRGAARVRRLCFAGGITEHHWPELAEELVDARSGALRYLGEEVVPEAAESAIEVLPPAPGASGLLGAGIYALAGAGGAASGLWSS